MLVFSNQRLGPAAELMVSRDVAVRLLRLVADAARSFASAYWERELVRWLDEQAVRATVTQPAITIDVGEIAFTPQHFDRQRRFRSRRSKKRVPRRRTSGCSSTGQTSSRHIRGILYSSEGAGCGIQLLEIITLVVPDENRS
jgi:hypothetical protein